MTIVLQFAGYEARVECIQDDHGCHFVGETKIEGCVVPLAADVLGDVQTKLEEAVIGHFAGR